MFLRTTFLFFLFLLPWASAFSEEDAPFLELRSPASSAAPSSEIIPIPPSSPEAEGTKFYKTEILSGLGLMLLGQPALALQFQSHFLLNPRRPLYLGADLSFALASPGYYFGLYPGAWYNFPLAENPLLHLTFGVLMGPAFCYQMLPIPPVSFAALGEASLSFEMDDLATVRGQFRTGIVGDVFSFGLQALIGFRFR
jgi:hypothetical protein